MIIGGWTVILWGPMWFAAQVCAGGPALALWRVAEYFAAQGGVDWANRFHEVGTLYAAVAGFLNLLVMMDAYIKLAYPHRGTELEAE
ncbi:MAG: hypothetical protein IMZ62_01835 [Chloroflexi bacterium]|nr:hypothetical protein [Chloroflexota bacterium]